MSCNNLKNVAIKRSHFLKDYLWCVGQKKSLNLGPQSCLMGILNITPDSFSDGSAYPTPKSIFAQANKMHEEGACIIDVGGESTRPGAEQVPVEEEQARIMPVIKKIVQNKEWILSVDTYHWKTAEKVLKAGVHIINDVSGLNAELAEVVGNFSAGVVLMHNGHQQQRFSNKRQFLENLENYFESALARALKYIKKNHIILDPGFGFGKSFDENLFLLNHFSKIVQKWDFPWLLGTSRKSFLGKMSGINDPIKRDSLTATTSAMLRLQGGHVFRVHNVKENKNALDLIDAEYLKEVE